MKHLHHFEAINFLYLQLTVLSFWVRCPWSPRESPRILDPEGFQVPPLPLVCALKLFRLKNHRNKILISPKPSYNGVTIY